MIIRARARQSAQAAYRVTDDAAYATVWREIAEHIDEPGFEGARVSVADAPRDSFSSHPWSIGGGGAAELKEAIDDEQVTTLKGLNPSVDVDEFAFAGGVSA